LQTQPDEDLQHLWEKIQSANGLDYALLKLGELDPERAVLGAADESDQAKIEGGLNWWDKNYTLVKKFVCQNKTIRTKGPVMTLQAIFGALAQPFGGAIATYVTVMDRPSMPWPRMPWTNGAAI
jgi:hypothetical protein